jgi:uncharacterized protein
MNLSLIIPAVLFFCISAYIHGYAGFGFGLIFITLLTFIPADIERLSVSGTILTLVVLVVMLVINRNFGKIYWRKAIPLICGYILGIPLGYRFLTLYGEKTIFGLTLGIILLAYAVYGLKTKTFERKIPSITGGPVGVLGGFISGAYISGGPPMVIYLYSQADDPREMKTTAQIVFIFGNVIRLITILLGPRGVTSEVASLSLIALPFCIPVLILGNLLSKKHSPELFKKVVYIVIGVLGIILLLKSLAKFAMV